MLWSGRLSSAAAWAWERQQRAAECEGILGREKAQEEGMRTGVAAATAKNDERHEGVRLQDMAR